jgi:hypothetical protein
MTRLSIKNVKSVKVNRRQRRNKYVVKYTGLDHSKEDHTDLDYLPEDEEEDDEENIVIQLQPVKQVRKTLKFLLRRSPRFLRRSPRFLRRSPRFLRRSPRFLKKL